MFELSPVSPSVRRPAHPWVVVALFLTAATAQPGWAQAKPMAGESIVLEPPTRLLAPKVSVEQIGNGCVRLSWSAIEGAARYTLGRSTGTNGYQRVPDAPSGPATEYLDSSVRADTRVSYTVTPVSAAGLAGVRATSQDFVPRIDPLGDCRGTAVVPPPAVTAQRSEQGIVVTASGSGIQRADFQHFLNGQSVGMVTDNSVPFQGFFDAVPGEHRFEVRTYDQMSNISEPGRATLVVAAPEATPITSSPSIGQSAELSFAVGATMSLRVGATAKLDTPSGAQWSSLDPAVASVNGDGVLKARAGGEARVVAVSAVGAGGVRVTVLHVVVAP